uniref:Uncharacterized protein n=1 Tax=Aegilops tauschii subsp. strangulata TaxID=200361 RepID=A0A452ZDZ5_AEGTS
RTTRRSKTNNRQGPHPRKKGNSSAPTRRRRQRAPTRWPVPSTRPSGRPRRRPRSSSGPVPRSGGRRQMARARRRHRGEPGGRRPQGALKVRPSLRFSVFRRVFRAISVLFGGGWGGGLIFFLLPSLLRTFLGNASRSGCSSSLALGRAGSAVSSLPCSRF